MEVWISMDDALRTKEFPKLNADQAKFMHLLLGKVNNPDDDEEVKELSQALVNAVTIKEQKYEFRIKSVESSGGKKSVVFEKVPVQIPIETAVCSDQTVETSKRSEVFKKIPVNISSGTALNSDPTAGKSRLTMEVTYVKSPKISKPGSVICTEAKETSDCGVSQRTPKKPKVNVQKALQLAATNNIKLDKVINLNQSLRSKKKNKKRKKPEIEKAKRGKGASSSSSSSRDSSRDRDNIKADMEAAFVPQAPKVAKRPPSEINGTLIKNTNNSRLTSEMLRNEKLMEALSVPVKSDKAMRMMFGMGWSGGALGTRGDGIIEPLMPTFEIANRAGFGLASLRLQNTNPVTVPPLPKKPKEPAPTPTFVAKKDIAVQKTKQLLPEDTTFDTIMKKTEPTNFKIDLQKASVEPPNPTTSKVELPTQTKLSIEPNRKPFRLEILHGVWDLINSDASIKCLNYETTLKKKQIKSVKSAMQILSGKKGKLLSCFQPEELPMCQKIREKYEEIQIVVEARFSWDSRVITLSKYHRFKSPNSPNNAVKRKTEVTVNLDDFSSETRIEPKHVDFCEDTYDLSGNKIKYEVFKDEYEVSEATNEVTETDTNEVTKADNTQVSTEYTTIIVSDDETSETLPISNELKHYDSDDSSVEEYDNNNANAKVAKLLPGEEGVNISNLLSLYDKEKTNDAVDEINKDESEVVINTDDAVDEINKDISEVVINTDDAVDEINKDVSEVVISQGKSMAVFNIVESSKDVEVAQIEEGTSNNLSDEKIVKDDLDVETDCYRINKENSFK